METAITASDLDDAKRALEAAGYTDFKGAAKPARLPNAQFYDCPFVPAPTLVDHRRSKVVRRTAQEIISRGIRSISSQLNWRTLEQAYVNVLPLEGEVWEAGVFKGVTALLLANAIRHYGPESAKLRLFDSFEGMPEADAERDFHKKGNFSDTSLEGVRDLVGDGLDISYQQGFIPDTFAGLESCKLKLVHVDLDLYQSILDTLEFCYPRMERGIFVLDDYGTPSCPGALQAVDEFFAGRPEKPFCFSTGQAIVFKF
jgi:O-methyltransferase